MAVISVTPGLTACLPFQSSETLQRRYLKLFIFDLPFNITMMAFDIWYCMPENYFIDADFWRIINIVAEDDVLYDIADGLQLLHFISD